MVTFSMTLVSSFVCSLVCLLSRLREIYSADFHKLLWNGGARARKQPLDCGDSPDRIIQGLVLR